MVRILIILLFTFIMSACTNDESKNCLLTIDIITELSNHDNFYVYKRISGISDKSRIVEIYKEKPVFDKCSKADKAPIFEDSVETHGHIKSITYHINSSRISIQYSESLVDSPIVYIEK